MFSAKTNPQPTSADNQCDLRAPATLGTEGCACDCGELIEAAVEQGVWQALRRLVQDGAIAPLARDQQDSARRRIRSQEVKYKCGFASDATLYRRVKARDKDGRPTFPQPVESNPIRYWDEAEIDDYFAGRWSPSTERYQAPAGLEPTQGNALRPSEIPQYTHSARPRGTD